jgi:5'-nucleotidase/UDP-sugar diphosphatase
VIIMADVAAEVQTEVQRLEGMGINKIILISHLQSLDEELALIPQLDRVDIVVAGGGDELLANPSNNLIPGDMADPRGYPVIAFDTDGTEVPVVTTSGNYQYVGRLVVGFNADGEIIQTDGSSGPVRVAGGGNADAVMPDPAVQAQVVDPVEAGLEGLANNIIGMSEVDLDGLRNSVRNFETNEGNLIADALKWQAEQLAGDFGVAPPDVALQNGGGIRNDTVIPAGDISELATFDMVPFSNFVSILENISRDQFKLILENAVSALPGGGRFAQVSGFSFVYDDAAADGARVMEVTLDDGTMIVVGGVVQPGASLTVATIDFLARGGDDYPFDGAPFTTLGVTYQQAVFNYIVDELGGTITAADYPVGGEGRITEL